MTLTEFLGNKVSSFLAHKERRRVRVRSQVVRADTQVDAFQVLRACMSHEDTFPMVSLLRTENVETMINHAALFARFHGYFARKRH
jgi:hypothetical protein